MSTPELVNRDWTIHAECRKHDPDLWFPKSIHWRTNIKAAVEICDTCPVIAECAQYAEHLDVSYGVWAGRFINGPYTKQRDLSPCGTVAAYRRHLRRRETPCVRCSDAERLRREQRKAKR